MVFFFIVIKNTLFIDQRGSLCTLEVVLCLDLRSFSFEHMLLLLNILLPSCEVLAQEVNV